MAYGLGLAGAAITAFYMFRLVFLTFHGESRLAPGVHVHHENPVMSWPLAILAFLAVVGGLPGASLFGVHSLDHFLEPVVATAPVLHKEFAHSHAAEWWAAGGSVLAGILGLALAFNLYLQRTSGPGHLAARFTRTYDLLKNKYYVDEIYEVFPIKFVYYLAMGLWRVVDVLIIDGLCVKGPAYAAKGLGFIGRELQSGNLQVYAFWIFIGFSGLLLYLAHGLGFTYNPGQPVLSTTGIVLLSLGRSSRLLKFGVAHSSLIVCAFLIGVHWGAIGVARGYAIVNYAVLLPALWYCFRGTPVKMGTAVRAAWRPGVASFAMAVAATAVKRWYLVGTPDIAVVGGCLAAGLCAYLVTWALVPGGTTVLKDFAGYVALIFSRKQREN